jgi:hypothetical protein
LKVLVKTIAFNPDWLRAASIALIFPYTQWDHRKRRAIAASGMSFIPGLQRAWMSFCMTQP